MVVEEPNSSVAPQLCEVKSPQQDIRRVWRQAIGILAKRGGRFVAIRRGDKTPRMKCWNQTANTLSADDALAHLHANGNAGLAAGTGNLYILDFDDNADRGHECPQLAGGLYIYRKNRTDKAKFIFTCDEPLPTRPRSRQHGIDLLGINANGTHAQGVIAGMHPSGSPYLWGGHTVPHLARDTVAALWQEWTGEELFSQPHPENDADNDPTYAGAKLGRVADALRYVAPNAIDYQTWQGIIAALHDAFAKGDDAGAALQLAVMWADGKPGEVEGKWASYARDYTGKPATLATVFYLARKAGWTDPWLQAGLHDMQRWLESPDAIADFKEVAPRSAAKLRKLLDVILQICGERRRLLSSPGFAYLATESGISRQRIGAYLATLYTSGWIVLHKGEDGAPWGLELVLRNWDTPPTSSTNQFSLSETPLPNQFFESATHDPSTLYGRGVSLTKNWILYREHRADELFINGHAAYTATHPLATLPSLGDNGLDALIALQDGPLTIRELADETGHSYGAMAGVMRRYAKHGLVTVTIGERNRKTYELRPEWRDILQANRPKTTTYGVMLFRRMKDLESRIKFLMVNGQADKANALRPQFDRLVKLADEVRAQAGIVSLPRRPKPPHESKQTQAQAPRARSKPMDTSDGERYRRKEYAQVKGLATAEWQAFNAWTQLEYGEGWWTREDETGVLGKYKVYEVASDFVPTMHYEVYA